jgi:hypothetical protein
MLYTIYNTETKEVLYCQDFEEFPIFESPLAATTQLNQKRMNKEMFDGKTFYESEPISLDVYAKELNDLHNLMLEDLIRRKNYLSLGDVQLWLNDENYGEEATQIINWYKSTYRLITDHLNTITEYKDPNVFIKTLSILY